MQVNYDFECRNCGEIFESRVESGTTAVSCPACMDSLADHVWVTPPMIDSLAAAMWNTPQKDMSRVREYQKKYNTITKEAGMKEEAERNAKYQEEKRKKEFGKKVEKWVSDKPIEWLQNAIKADAELLDAQAKRDANKIKRMGGVTSVKEAYKVADEAKPLVLERTDARK